MDSEYNNRFYKKLAEPTYWGSHKELLILFTYLILRLWNNGNQSKILKQRNQADYLIFLLNIEFIFSFFH